MYNHRTMLNSTPDNKNMVNNVKFISVPTDHNDTSHKFIKNTYDHIFDPDLFNNKINTSIPKIYQEIYNFFKNINDKDKYVTISKEPTISASTIAAINEKYMTRNENYFSSDLRIIYFDSNPNIDTNIYSTNLKNRIVSSLMGLTEISFSDHKLLLKPEQIIYFGLDENVIENDQTMLLDQLEIKYFTLERIRKIGIAKLLKYILNEFNGHPIHVVFNFSIIDPNVIYNMCNNGNDNGANNGFNLDEINTINELLKNKVKSLDVTGFNITPNGTPNDLLKCNLIKIIIIGIMNVKEKKLNIFTEDSRFLIYRPIDYEDSFKNNEEENEDEDEDKNDYGWYILRFLNLEQRDNILSNINDDDIVPITINDDDEEIDIIISSTTISEQEKMSYYTCNNIMDRCLYPSEKTIMLFELLNTP